LLRFGGISNASIRVFVRAGLNGWNPVTRERGEVVRDGDDAGSGRGQPRVVSDG
jgi:hypothetical protein